MAVEKSVDEHRRTLCKIPARAVRRLVFYYWGCPVMSIEQNRRRERSGEVLSLKKLVRARLF